MKSDCLCTVNASKYAALEGWWGTCSRYWYTAAERKKKKKREWRFVSGRMCVSQRGFQDKILRDKNPPQNLLAVAVIAWV